jgi:Bacterial Ig-like domain (group 3)
MITNGTLTVSQAASTTSLKVSDTAVTPSESVTLTAQVSSATTGTPTGSVSFYDSQSLLSTSTLSSGTATYTTTTLSAGTSHALTAVYSGDANFTASTDSTGTTVSVAPLGFTLTVPGPSTLTVAPGSSVSYKFNLDPLYGAFAGPVSFTVSGLPSGATAAFSPSTVAADAGKQTITLTIKAPAAVSMQHTPSQGKKLASIILALLLFPLLAAGRMRKLGRRMSRILSLLLLSLSGVLAATVLPGCGGRSHGSFPPPETSYILTVTAASGKIQQSVTVILKVQ